jgi:hypothetical protein
VIEILRELGLALFLFLGTLDKNLRFGRLRPQVQRRRPRARAAFVT